MSNSANSSVNNPFVGILMGSDSDLPIMQETVKVLDGLGIQSEINVMSAHRTPQVVAEYIAEAEQRGAQIFIAGAGLAAHLAGAIAAKTVKPVIGIPLDAGSLGGLDALLSTVQMPAGIPVATVAIGKAGAKNAAWLAAQILSLNDENLGQLLRQKRLDDQQRLAEINQSL